MPLFSAPMRKLAVSRPPSSALRSSASLVLRPLDSDRVTPRAFLGLHLAEGRLWDFSASKPAGAIPILCVHRLSIHLHPIVSLEYHWVRENKCLDMVPMFPERGAAEWLLSSTDERRRRKEPFPPEKAKVLFFLPLLLLLHHHHHHYQHHKETCASPQGPFWIYLFVPSISGAQ